MTDDIGPGLTTDDLATFQRIQIQVHYRAVAIIRRSGFSGYFDGTTFESDRAEINGTDHDGDEFTLVVPVSWFTCPENELPPSPCREWKVTPGIFRYTYSSLEK